VSPVSLLNETVFLTFKSLSEYLFISYKNLVAMLIFIVLVRIIWGEKFGKTYEMKYNTRKPGNHQTLA
jgi:hypothetical protein